MNYIERNIEIDNQELMTDAFPRISIKSTLLLNTSPRAAFPPVDSQNIQQNVHKQNETAETQWRISRKLGPNP